MQTEVKGDIRDSMHIYDSYINLPSNMKLMDKRIKKNMKSNYLVVGVTIYE